MKKISLNLNTIALLFATVLMVPQVTHAQSTAITNLVSMVQNIITALFPILVAAGILMFGYNITKFLLSQDQKDQNLYKKGIWNSLIALFIVFVFVGIITTLANSLGIGALGQDITTSSPAGTTAGTAGGISTFRNISLSIAKFGSQKIVPIMIAVSLLFFIGNIVISMAKSDNENERTKLNKYILWGILALFVLLTLFSIVGIFTGSLFGTGAVIPQFPTS